MSSNLERYTTQIKEGRFWVDCFTTHETAEIYKALAHDLEQHFIMKAAYIKRVRREYNYSGYATITITYDNDSRAVYVVRN